MFCSEKVCDLFGEDVQHLHGNLFRVKRDKIHLAKSGLVVENGQLIYGNPRWFLNKDGEPEAKGINTSKMEELRNSIQEDGLENPFRLRIVEGDESFLEVVNGERRYRCIETLCNNDSLCKNPASGELESASDVYEWVDCRVDFMDDATALGVALRPNETSEVIGDMANINVVKALRESGHDDQDILRMTGKSVSWLRETETIIGLDDVCFEQFQDEKISRKVALHLALIDNAEERLDLLERLKESAEARHAEKVKEVTKKLDSAKQEQEVQEAAAEWAKNDGDDGAVELHSKKAKNASKKVASMKEEQKKAKEKPATANSKDLQKVAKPNPLSHKKIQSVYMKYISKLLKNEGVTEPDEEGDSYFFDVTILSAIVATLEAIMKGDQNVLDVLIDHAGRQDEASAEESEDDSYEDVEAIAIETEEEASDNAEESFDEDDDEDDDDDDDDEDEVDVIEDEYEDLSDDLVKEFEEEIASMNDESDE